MVNYFLHRIAQGQQITFDYLGSGASVAQTGDIFVIYESHTLQIRAIAELSNQSFINIREPIAPVKISEILSELSFIHTAGESMVRSLKKKNRLITHDDFLKITSKIQLPK
jgi:serine/threonine protein kinase